MARIAGTIYGYRNLYNELVIGNVDSFPIVAKKGQIVWLNPAGSLFVYDGNIWREILLINADAIFDTLTVVNDSFLGRHVYIHDEMVTLNYGETGAGISQWSTSRAGIEIARGSEPTVSLFYDETIDRWSLTNDGSSIEIVMTNITGIDYFLRLDGTNSPVADISFGNNKITNLKDAEDGYDAANKRTAIKFAIVLG